MKVWSAVICMLGAFLAPRGALDASGGDSPVLPRASLLVGFPPFVLMVTRTQESLTLQPEPNQRKDGDRSPVYPSISRDGKVVAYARVKVSVPKRIVAISTYSTTGGGHRDYSEGEYTGAVAISQDASKLAFSASRRKADGRGDDHLHIIDLGTGQQTLGPEVPSFRETFASWSPDSRRLAYSFNGEVRVWDAESGRATKIADGDAPAWSPSGEWIAYFQGVLDRASSAALKRNVFERYVWEPRCLAVHPDGSGGKILADLGDKRGSFVAPPVWSPDSNTILLNEIADVDTGTVDIHLLDVKTLKLKTVFKNALPVLGWAEAK